MPKTKLPEAVERQAAEIEAFEAAAAAPPEAEAPAAPPPEPQAPPPPAEQTVNWEHKYNTLQGVHRSDVARLTQQVNELTQKVNELSAAPVSPPPPPPPVEQPQLVTDKDVEAFGSDLVDLMRRVSKETNGPEKARMEQEIAELRAQVPDLTTRVENTEKTQDQETWQTFIAELAKQVPDYQEVNADQAWLDWLVLKDPMSGIIRNELLQTAQAGRDIARVVLMFQTFKQETGTKPPAAEPAPAPKSGLESEVSPGTSRTAAPAPSSDAGKVWTGQEVQDFYNACTRGDYRDKPADAKRIDAEIDQAFIEGRVRG